MFGILRSALRKEVRQEAEPPLVGVWELLGVRRDGLPLPGVVPNARILFTPGGRFIALLPANDDPGLAEVFREAFPYSGGYRVVGESWITTQQRSWSDLSAEGEQVHFFRIEDAGLNVRQGRGEFVFARLG